jgi:hypothetical protein
MKKIILAAIFLCMINSCSTLKVSCDYDQNAKFDTYKTFEFSEMALYFPIEDLSREILLSAIEDEMKQKGFTKAENADIMIDLQLNTQEKASVSSYPTGDVGGYGYGYGGGFGYGSGYAYAWGSGFTTSAIYVDHYADGTLFIDMIDTKTKQLVWQGRGKGSIDPDADELKRDTNIRKAVNYIFSRYPPGDLKH